MYVINILYHVKQPIQVQERNLNGSTNDACYYFNLFMNHLLLLVLGPSPDI